MIFVTVCDALKAKISSFVLGRCARRNVEQCSLINESRCDPSEHKLHESHEIRLHRAVLCTTGSPANYEEFFVKVRETKVTIRPRVVGGGHENNTSYAYLSNLKLLGSIFGTNDAALRPLAGDF